MIVGIGIDVVEIDWIKWVVEKILFFINKVLMKGE